MDNELKRIEETNENRTSLLYKQTKKKRQEKKEMFYLTTQLTHFIYDI